MSEQLNARQVRSIAKFEAHLDDLIADGARDRAAAIKWLRAAQVNPAAANNEFMEYEYDLPCGYLNKTA